MLDQYYALRHWSRDGIPTPEHLVNLGLSDVAEAGDRITWTDIKSALRSSIKPKTRHCFVLERKSCRTPSVGD